MIKNTLPDDSYVVTVGHYLNRDVQYVSLGFNLIVSKRAADQFRKGMAKIDARYKNAKTLQRKTARQRAVWGV